MEPRVIPLSQYWPSILNGSEILAMLGGLLHFNVNESYNLNKKHVHNADQLWGNIFQSYGYVSIKHKW